MWEVVRSCGRSVDMYIDSVAKLSIATGHAMLSFTTDYKSV